MDTLIINNKKYVVLEARSFEKLQTKAAQKTSPIKKLSLNDGKKYAYKLIDKWSKEK